MQKFDQLLFMTKHQERGAPPWQGSSIGGPSYTVRQGVARGKVVKISRTSHEGIESLIFPDSLSEVSGTVCMEVNLHFASLLFDATTISALSPALIEAVQPIVEANKPEVKARTAKHVYEHRILEQDSAEVEEFRFTPPRVENISTLREKVRLGDAARRFAKRAENAVVRVPVVEEYSE
jgi:hypothetical protein